jgi:hypothetical protein
MLTSKSRPPLENTGQHLRSRDRSDDAFEDEQLTLSKGSGRSRTWQNLCVDDEDVAGTKC